MNTEDGTNAVGIEDMDAPILPSGWKEEDDLFADVTKEEDLLSTDGQKQTDTEVKEDEDGAGSTETDPTTDGDAAGSDDAAGDETGDGSDGSAETDPMPTRKLKLKVNHKEEEVDVNQMSDDELIERLQKAAAFDAMKDDQQKEKYRKVYNDELLAGMSEAAAKMVAAHSVGGKDYPLEDTVEEPTAAAESTHAAQPTRSTDDDNFKAQLKQLRALDPDCKEIPPEVLTAYLNGAELLPAYAMYQVKQSKKAAAKIQKENQVLKQNAAAAAQAPVKGVANSGASGKGEADDPFLKGLRSDGW